MFVLPVYRDDDDPPLLPVVLTLLLLSNVGIWFAVSIWGSGEGWFATYGFTPARASISSALTSMFFHAGFWHLAGNMWFLWMLGRRVENTLGSFLFMVVYVVSGLGGAGLHFLLNRHAVIPCVGASGAISGVLGCFWVLFPRASFDLEIYLGWWRVKQIPSETTGAAAAWLAEQILLGMLSQAVMFSSVAFWAHVGGFMVGICAAIILRKTGRVEADAISTGPVMSRAEIARLDTH